MQDMLALAGANLLTPMIPCFAPGLVAAHYGSISIVTFVTGSAVLRGAGLVAEGYMVAVAAAMEAPAIIAALYLAARAGGRAEKVDADLWRAILLTGPSSFWSGPS